MNFYIIYVDEFGDTGFDLNNPDQPLFILQAALVPADNNSWINVERECTKTIDEIYKKTGSRKNIERLHASDLYQGKKPFKLDPGYRLDVIERIFNTAKNNNVKYLSMLLPKTSFKYKKHNGKHLLLLSGSETSEKILSLPISLYEFGFIHLLIMLQNSLNELDANALIILDQKEEHKVLPLLDSYRALRAAGFLDRIVDYPSFQDSRNNTMLFLPDLSGYIYGKYLVSEFLEKEIIPELLQWKQNYIDKQTLDNELPDISPPPKKLILNLQ